MSDSDERDENADTRARLVTCIDCGAQRPTRETIGTEHGPVCAGACDHETGAA